MIAKRQYMYNAMVEGKANAVFDTADEALQFAMHHVYLGSKDFIKLHHALENGKQARYAYGFSTVHIVPVAKRIMRKEVTQ